MSKSRKQKTQKDSLWRVRSKFSSRINKLDLLSVTVKSEDDPFQIFETKYNLSDEILGKGGFSTVVGGQNRVSGEQVAIKIVVKTKLLDDERDAFFNEISLLDGITHQNIVHFIEWFDEIKNFYIVEERMNGGDLHQRLEQVFQFPEYEAKKIIKNITDALDYLHNLKIGHRDVKLENIMLQTESNSLIAKLTDFGLAKKLSKVDCKGFTTMCGTLSYVAPEVLQGNPYGLNVDCWSLGVVIYSLLVGYQPFWSNDEDELSLKRNILNDQPIPFDEEDWDGISIDAKNLITSLLQKDLNQRLAMSQVKKHSWFTTNVVPQNSHQDKHQVFFMIGSQRSGSNWLRTMLDEREDLAGPHPPHIMRDFIPIIGKFGDLSLDINFRILCDHVCTFVEKNQVPWTDKHGRRIKFCRIQVYSKAIRSCKKLLLQRGTTVLSNGLYLLSIFDAIMENFTLAYGKRTWICKSMGMSKFHNLLLEFYGESRLRYIYLVRDPRDVAMSFMKTPVGDCHYYSIASKWTELQKSALHILKTYPNIIHQVHYEQILKGKKSTISKIYDFIGERRHGGIRRQSTVLNIRPIDECLSRSQHGSQSNLARNLSYQFKNLVRGDSFLNEQFQKWKDPLNGLKEAEIVIIESVAVDVMKELGYSTHLVGKSFDKSIFTPDDVEQFDKLNKEAVEQMNDTLKVNDLEDFERRRTQAAVLSLEPILLSDWEDEENIHMDPFISNKALDEVLIVEDVESVPLSKGGRMIKWATASQKGYYPDNKDIENQDSFKVQMICKDLENPFFCFSIFDGHGAEGHKCSHYASEKLPERFEEQVVSKRVSSHKCETKSNQTVSPMIVKSALFDSHVSVHKELSKEIGINSTRSGTTATNLVFLSDNKIIISNLGDSCCIMGTLTHDNTKYKAKVMTKEHNLSDKNELDRVKKSGPDCFIMTLEEKEEILNTTETQGPSRIWHLNPDKSPGVAFTRSIGDDIAHQLGVIACPDIEEENLSNDGHFIILCSDGVTEWIDTNTIVNIVSQYNDPKMAATALVKEARKRWLKHTDYIDDITAIVIFVEKVFKYNGCSKFCIFNTCCRR